MFKSDGYDSISSFFFIIDFSPKKLIQVLHGLNCLGGAA